MTGAPAGRVAAALTRSTAVASVGDGMFYVISAVALVRLTGSSAGTVGLVLSGVWLLAWTLTPSVGSLGDRLGLGQLTVVCALVVAGALAGLSVAHGLPSTAMALAVYAIGQAGLLGLRQAVVATSVEPGRRTTLRATLQVLANAGIAVGAGLGGLALAANSLTTLRALFAVDAVAFVVAAYLLLPVRHVVPDVPLAHLPGPTAPGRGGTRPDRRFLVATALATVVMLYMPMLSVGLPLAVTGSALPTWVIGAVFVTNTVGVVALQRWAARSVTGLQSSAAALRRAAVGLPLGCLAFGLALRAGPPLGLGLAAVGVTAQVLGEVFAGAGLWELGFRLAAATDVGRWQATWASSIPAARAVGPALLTWLVVTHGLAGWVVLGLALALAALTLARTAAASAIPT